VYISLNSFSLLLLDLCLKIEFVCHIEYIERLRIKSISQIWRNFKIWTSTH